MAQAVFLWQYLCRTGSPGYFLALSGGLDSATVALFVYSMTRLVLQSIDAGEMSTLDDLRRVTGDKTFMPETPQEIVARLLHTCYMGTINSGDDTRSRARRFAGELGAYYSDISIDEAVQPHEAIIEKTLNFKIRYGVEGGSPAENRRIVSGYRPSREHIEDRRQELPIMAEFLEATPSAELLPLSAGVQDDEADTEMGLTELSEFGIMRKVHKLGAWSTYLRLLGDWKERPGYGPRQIAERVKRFFRFYSINRHKAVILTPSPHLSAYNPDDNRHDLRPFLYVVNWPWQFGKIDAHAEDLERKIADRDRPADTQFSAPE
ncbi:adenine nucleotide alpha hydrolases-like protein [Colletotrichum somersetense]|nr:adenine nucleotide alpha hydrolases-like protein [Colletotrichum somersetense]